MDIPEGWKETDTSENHSKWIEEETGREVKVTIFEEDDTWDTFLEEKLIANRDTAEEAVERGIELMKNLSRN